MSGNDKDAWGVDPDLAPAQAMVTDGIRPDDIKRVAAAAGDVYEAVGRLLTAWEVATRELPLNAANAVDVALAVGYPFAASLQDTDAAMRGWADDLRHLAGVAANAPYVRAVAAHLRHDPQPIARWLSNHCGECGTDITDPDSRHVLVGGYVVICCEGYLAVDPNAVGIPAPNWQDWTAGN